MKTNTVHWVWCITHPIKEHYPTKGKDFNWIMKDLWDDMNN